ncbi:MAG: putative Ig domain-containing protein [Candidatus Thermoplasmatota archaeon]|nr:putative Ig domain-containing protein [Candidatus Thermoplasmatota archaeon]
MNRQHIAFTLLLALAAASSAQATVDDARAKGIKWLVQTQKGDGSFAGLQGLEAQSTSAAVEAMLAAGLNKSPQYARALAWLANAPGGSLDSRAWQAAALAAAGRDAKAIAGTIRDERNVYVVQSGSLPTGGVATWGAYPGYGASTIDTALGYGALRSAGVSYANDTTDLTVTVLCNILPAQLGSSPWSGAWPHALPQSGQPSHATTGSLAATAIMLHELKKQRQAGRFLSGTVCGKTSPGAIDTAMTSAKTWLIAQANGDGGFAERNPQTGNLEASAPVATAMAIRALALFAAEGDTAANTAITNARTWLDAQQNADGNWRGDPFVTARVVAALPAAAGAQLTDSDQDGLTDVVEQQLGTQVLVADAQDQLDPNANAMPGLTATSFSVSAVLNEAFSYAVSASGGNGPFTFARVNGALPPGLTLAANGQISGAPTALGSYAFDYEITDAANAKTLSIGRIDVTAAPSDGDVPLPAWALVALGAGLLGALRRHSVRTSA